MSKELVNTTNTLPVLLGSSNLDAYIRAARSVPILTLEHSLFSLLTQRYADERRE